MAFQTANGKYSYDQIFEDKTLDEWIQRVHKNNCEINGWKIIPLKKGAFGYDNLAISIGDMFTKFPHFRSPYSDSNLAIEILTDIIYKAWRNNYIYWRDNEPWVNEPQKYIIPEISLGKKYERSNTTFGLLSADEQKKDEDIAKFMYYS